MSVSLLPGTRFKRSKGVDDDVVETVADPLQTQKRIFWTAHSRLGYLTLTAGSLFVLSYFVVTPNGPHRLAACALSGLTLVAAIVTLALISRVSTHPWRISFSVASTLLAGFALTICIWLDGGLDSPLVVLIALPVMSAALALPPRQVTMCGCAALGELGVVAWTDARVEAAASDIAALVALVIGTAVLCSASALYRARLEVDEDRLVEDLHHQASTDALTGCLSHGAFYNRLDIEIDRALRHGESLSLLVADIDLFKSFNDAHGHAAGDVALAEAGANLRRGSRSIDTVARVGGDEFRSDSS